MGRLKTLFVFGAKKQRNSNQTIDTVKNDTENSFEKEAESKKLEQNDAENSLEKEAESKKTEQIEKVKVLKKSGPSVLAPVFDSLATLVKIDKMVDKQLEISKKDPTSVKTEDAGISSAWVYRLEHILNGKSFEQIEEVVNGLFSTQNNFYKEKIKSLQKERSQISDEEALKQFEEYEYILQLANKKRNRLSMQEKKFLYDTYKKMRQTEMDIYKGFDKDFLDEESFFGDKKFETLQEYIALGLAEPKTMQIDEDLAWYRKKLIQNEILVKKHLNLAINKNVLFEHFDEVKHILRAIRNKAYAEGKQIELVIDDDGYKKHNSKDIAVPYNYSTEQMEKLSELYYYTDSMYFSEFKPKALLPFDENSLWTYKEVVGANYTKNFFVGEFEKLNLTPFEKILIVHHYVTLCVYQDIDFKDTKDFGNIASRYPKLFEDLETEAKQKDKSFGPETDAEKSRTFLTAYSSTIQSKQAELKIHYKGFVCTGFASYAKAIIDSMNDKNIQCEFISPIFYKKDTNKINGAHSILLVTIKDDEYGIKGTYGWDPCWDAGCGSFSFCLFPLEDYINYKSDKKYIKIQANQNTNTHDVLLAVKVPKKLKGDEDNLILGDRNVEYVEPISIETFDKGFSNLAKKTRSCPNCHLQSLPKDFASESLTATIYNLNTFDAVLAKNSFYAFCRDIYIKKSEKYPNWEKKFTSYNKERRVLSDYELD